jgi:hypothetical protein
MSDADRTINTFAPMDRPDFGSASAYSMSGSIAKCRLVEGSSPIGTCEEIL